MCSTRITQLFGIPYPIIQAGMVWVSGHKLASAVSNAGGLGLIGAGSMRTELLAEHIRKCKQETDKPFGVNIPLLRQDSADLVQCCIEAGVRIIFTSAGHPAKHMKDLLAAECTVVHVVPAVKHAMKAEEAGCHAVVAEGFEAGGHNGADETTTMCLVPQVADAVTIPVIAAGGIADGRGMLAAFALGAEGVQIGTRFAATIESSGHQTFKEHILNAGDAGTVAVLKKIGLTRLLKTPFAKIAMEADARGADKDELLAILDTKRERKGMFEGNVEEGEFEAGQCSGLIKNCPSAGEVVTEIMQQFQLSLRDVTNVIKNPSQ